MDADQMYYGGLVLIAILAWMSYNSNRNMTAIFLLIIGAYFIYSHNTGTTITGMADDTVNTLDKELR